MKKISKKEMQNIQLEILKEVAHYCDKKKLKYYLSYGTLLGAVIKKGFRNENSDIDILMFRDDYDRFCQEFYAKNLKLLDCRNKDYYYAYAKVVNTKTIVYEQKSDVKDLGVYIDVMPIDYLPKNYFARKLYIFQNYLLELLSVLKRGAYLEDYNWLSKIIYKIGSLLVYIIPSNYFSRLIDKIRRKYSRKASNEIIISFINMKYMPKKIFDERIKFYFEGHKFYGPKDYEKCLDVIFGDYRKTKVKKHHNHIKGYWK